MAMRCPNCGFEGPEGTNFCGNCGRPIGQVILGDRVGTYVPAMYPYKLRLNVFCLAGAMLAVLSLFQPWVSVYDNSSGIQVSYSALDFSDSEVPRSLFSAGVRYAVTVFIIGAILAFFTPLAGIPLVVGCAGFALGVSTGNFAALNVGVALWFGWVVACVSVILVIASAVLPIGMGFGRDSDHTVVARLLVWSLYR
jgi:hypothetical protein